MKRSPQEGPRTSVRGLRRPSASLVLSMLALLDAPTKGHYTFNGRRVVIFSGGPATSDAQVFDEVRAIRDGGGFGSIIGRNSFQRKKPDAVKFLDTIMRIYSGELK